MSIITATITLFLIMDPLGNIPIFLSVLKGVEQSRRRRIILRETFIALIILTAFLFWGQYILHGMQISMPALSIAGGIILFLIAIKMIFPQTEEEKSKNMGEPFIVPLAVPMIAGPSTMAMVMLMATREPTKMWEWAIALFIAWSLSTVILLCGEFLRKILGDQGLIAVERLMGMILTTMSVQMFLTGVATFFHLQIF